MVVHANERGFPVLHHPPYPPEATVADRLVQQSSIVGDYPDAMERPGTSALWIGSHHHLNREEVAQLVTHLQRWLDTGAL
jgi:hypothetical protein